MAVHPESPDGAVRRCWGEALGESRIQGRPGRKGREAYVCTSAKCVLSGLLAHAYVLSSVCPIVVFSGVRHSGSVFVWSAE